MRDSVFIFFFQAKDGIRDHCVTGVQTCALPIWLMILKAKLVEIKKFYALQAERVEAYALFEE